MDEAEILAAIRLDIEVYNFGTDEVHTAPHMAAGAFNEDDIVAAVLNGEVIEPSSERNRWLYYGRVVVLCLMATFHGRWLHVSVGYDEAEGTTVVTAYRPAKSVWRTERERR